MGLFELLRISTDCYLCGCPVTSSSKQNLDTSNNTPIICSYCHQHLPKSSETCISCGLPLNKTTFNNTNVNPHLKQSLTASIPCGECLKQSPPYDRTLSGFHYEPPINDFITQLKYSAQFQLLPLLCDYLLNNIKKNYQNKALPESLLPVPLHPNKLVQRGFNQSQLIAAQLAKTLDLQIISKGIRRVKQTKAQSGLDSVERKSNVKNAFSIEVKLPDHVAIVDDVVTTGMTVSELAKQARLHGATQIDVWCLARAYDL